MNLNFIKELSESDYGKYVLGGVIGSLIDRLRSKDKVSLGRFLANIGIGIFIGVLTGLTLKNYTSFSDDMIFVFVSLASNMGRYFLDELQEIVSYISVFVKKLADKKAGLNTDK